MKAKKITLHNLRNDGHFQFIEFVITLIRGVGAALLRIEKQFNVLAALHAQEDEAYRKIIKSALTAHIDKADSDRDDVFRSLANAIRSGLTHFNPLKREAATRLKIVLDAYGDVTQKSNIDEIAAVRNLLQELSLKHAACVATLELGEWIIELGRRNSIVETLLEERADEGNTRTKLVLKEVRLEVDEAYRTLVELIDSLCIVAHATENAADIAMYDNFISRLNQRIDLLNNSIAQRRGHADAKKKNEE
ncbi:MAG: DUF6261 family protein [Cytophagaceae bacterium]|jgi:hypothetical protein|nr:DUF6261 family protein [Cytophagaceae bacterium]